MRSDMQAIILAMSALHTHPRPWIDRLVQFGAVGFLAVTAALFVWQIALALSGLPPALLLLTTLTMALLIVPALWLTTATPAVELRAAGLTLHPRIWRQREIAWADIRAVKPYPLLPEQQGEQVRKAFVGRRKYVPAQGVMLIVPSLPWIYRCTGFLAGEGFTPVVALTNRTHTDYDRLIKGVRVRTAEVWS